MLKYFKIVQPYIIKEIETAIENGEFQCYVTCMTLFPLNIDKDILNRITAKTIQWLELKNYNVSYAFEEDERYDENHLKIMWKK